MEAVQEFAHEDYAIIFEAYWELWTPASEGGQWSRRENKVSFILHGTEFDEGVYTEYGHIEIDFGLDFPFLYEEMDLSAADQQRVRENVAQLHCLHACTGEALPADWPRALVGERREPRAKTRRPFAKSAVDRYTPATAKSAIAGDPAGPRWLAIARG